MAGCRTLPSCANSDTLGSRKQTNAISGSNIKTPEGAQTRRIMHRHRHSIASRPGGKLKSQSRQTLAIAPRHSARVAPLVATLGAIAVSLKAASASKSPLPVLC